MSQEEKPFHEQVEDILKDQLEAPSKIKALNEQVKYMAQQVEAVKGQLANVESQRDLAVKMATDKARDLDNAERELRRLKERNEYLEALGKKPETCQAQDRKSVV